MEEKVTYHLELLISATGPRGCSGELHDSVRQTCENAPRDENIPNFVFLMFKPEDMLADYFSQIKSWPLSKISTVREVQSCHVIFIGGDSRHKTFTNKSPRALARFNTYKQEEAKCEPSLVHWGEAISISKSVRLLLCVSKLLIWRAHQ